MGRIVPRGMRHAAKADVLERRGGQRGAAGDVGANRGAQRAFFVARLEKSLRSSQIRNPSGTKSLRVNWLAQRLFTVHQTVENVTRQSASIVWPPFA